MSKLWKYFKGYRREAIAAPFMKMLEALLELMIPLFVAEIIDVGIAEGRSEYVWQMCGLMVLFGTIGVAVSITSQYFSAKAAVGFSCAVRRDLYKRTLALPRAESDALGSATLLTRLTADVDRLQNGINIGLRLLLRSPFIVFGAVIMAFLSDWQVALVFLREIAAKPAITLISPSTFSRLVTSLTAYILSVSGLMIQVAVRTFSPIRVRYTLVAMPSAEDCAFIISSICISSPGIKPVDVASTLPFVPTNINSNLSFSVNSSLILYSICVRSLSDRRADAAMVPFMVFILLRIAFSAAE